MAGSTKSVNNDQNAPNSSDLQYVGPSGSFFRYREISSGAEFDASAIIDGAKGNPPKGSDEVEAQGKTDIEIIGVTNGGLYGSKPEEDSRKYQVNVETKGTGKKAKVTDKGETVDGGRAVQSSFNRWSLFKTKNAMAANADEKGSLKDLMSKNLNGPPSSLANNPTARNIVKYAKDNHATSLGFDYDLTDFIQCEHYGAISNNYLITLRRFPYPVDDDIVSPKVFNEAGKAIDSHQPDLARAITWMSPSLGNDLKSILNFKVGYNWKDVESQLQEVQAGKANRGALGASIDSSPLLSAIEAGMSGKSADETARIKGGGGGYDPVKGTYPNKVFGPYNIIKKILAREQGLKFEQSFSLTFHYDIRGYGNTSPKAAFMDTMANLLALTYSTAPFWGGATRYIGSGGSAGKPFGDYNKLRNGDYSGFLTGLANQFTGSAANGAKGVFGAIGDAINGGGLNALGNSKILDNIIGGGLMKLFNGPQGGQVAAAMIAGDPTGNWHLTVGNPMSPMMVIGNLAMQDANFEFEGPLGYEDFPTKLKVTITLKPGRPRDKGEIESMFNAGRGRMYLQPNETDAPEETISDVYGGKSMSNAMRRRASDMNAG